MLFTDEDFVNIVPQDPAGARYKLKREARFL